MVLRMALPFQHPKTGIFWLRKRVPNELVLRLGKKEERFSLRTRDPREAKRRHVEALERLERQWETLRAGIAMPQPAAAKPGHLTEREAHARAAWMFEFWLRKYQDNPSEQTFWQTELFGLLWAEPKGYQLAPDGTLKKASVDMRKLIAARKLEAWCLNESDDLLALHELDVDARSRLKVAKAIAAAVQRASLLLERYARGEQVKADRAGYVASSSEGAGATKICNDTLTDLLEAWWREALAAGRKPSTYESYRNSMKAFVSFLGHQNPNQVTVEDVIAFKDHRLTTPSPRTKRLPSAKTVKDSDLAGLKTVFGWAMANRKMATNPAAGVTIKVGKTKRLRSKGFTDEEAAKILTAALHHQPGNENPKTTAAKRWVPWLCAFTGARVGEMAQLRKQDVFKSSDRWVVRITPEAGTVKTDEAREVVLHHQLLEQGFPDFVAAAPEGHLFLNPNEDGSVPGPLQGLKNRLAEFARAIVPDRGVAPNHGWRHRFKTVGMEVGIAPRILDAIQGQAARSVADKYGDVTLKTIAQAIDLLPPIVAPTST